MKGQDIGSGRNVVYPAYNTAVLTAYGSATAAGAVATFTLSPGARALILKVYVTNEGTGGASVFALESNGSKLIPYYLPSAGEITDNGTLTEPIAFIANTTTSAITVGIYATSVASGNTVEAAINYMIMPDWRPPA